MVRVQGWVGDGWGPGGGVVQWWLGVVGIQVKISGVWLGSMVRWVASWEWEGRGGRCLGVVGVQGWVGGVVAVQGLARGGGVQGVGG